MAISNEIFTAILAMDAYNRSYNAGVRSPGAALNEGLTGSQIGNAILRQDVLPQGSQAASFFAQAYTWNGQTVISYRGSDGLFPPWIPFLGGVVPSDIGDWSIWLTDNYDTPQARLAADSCSIGLEVAAVIATPHGTT